MIEYTSEYIANLITEILSDGNTHSVKALVEESECSETTVRGYLKRIPNVESCDAPGGKGKVFFIAKPLTLAERETEKAELHPIIEQMAAEGEALDAPAQVSEAKPKAKKSAPLNPQYIINAKKAAIEAAGGTLTFSNRQWTITLGKEQKVLTSKEFSVWSPDF